MLRNASFWDEYMKAYADVLTRNIYRTGSVVRNPADNKWFMRYAVGTHYLRADETTGPALPQTI